MSGGTKKNNDKLVKMASLRVTNGNLQKMKQNPTFTAYIYIYTHTYTYTHTHTHTYIYIYIYISGNSYFILKKIIQVTKNE